MNKYELTVILKPNLDEETLKSEFEKTLELVTQYGGQVDKVAEWGKRRLAYEIQKVVDGVYYFVNFSAEGNVPAEIEQRLRIRESILRYLIIREEA